MLSANELGDAKVAFEKALDLYKGSEARIGLARVEWEKASEQYEWILDRDSMYQNILYQYAVHWKHACKPLRAMSLAHEQTVLKPGLKEAQTELIRI